MSGTNPLNRVLGRIYSFTKNYYVNRTFQAILTLYVVITLAFILMRLMPGGPIQRMKVNQLQQCREQGGECDIQKINTYVETYTNINPDQPLLVQYVDYMSAFLTGDFGTSIWYGLPVRSLVAEALPWTMLLSSATFLMSMVTGILLGMLMAYYEGSKFDIGLTMYTIFMGSIPGYVMAIMFIYVFVYQFSLFPNGGQYAAHTTIGLNIPFIRGVLYYASLPISAQVITGFMRGGLGLRANSIRILGEDYLRVARLRGLSSYRIAVRYVGRNAILPVYTGFMMSLSGFFGSSVIIEQIFKYPGMGYVMFNAVMRKDYPLMLGGFIMITTMTILGILIADFTYGYIDPRASTGDDREAFGSSASTLRAFTRSIKSMFSGDTGTTLQTEEDHTWDRFDEKAKEAQERGEATPLDFTFDAEYEESTTDRLFRMFDTYIYAPLMVIWSDIRGKVAIFILSVYILMGTVGVLLTDVPTANEGGRLVQPFTNPAFPLGTDGLGQDLMALMIHATPAMFKMVFAGGLLATAIATTVGILSGFRGGLTDRVLMTCADIIMTIPGLPLTIILAAIFEPRSPYVVGMLLTVDAWGGTARQIRSQILTLRGKSYVEASRAMGISTSTILYKDLLPNIAPYALIKFIGKSRRVIGESVALYFLGVLPFSNLNWGVTLNTSYKSGTALLTWKAAHWFIVPMLTIAFFGFGLIMFAQAADQLTNPRVRARHAKTVDEDESVAARS